MKIYTYPRPFDGLFKTIQYNAIMSWMQLPVEVVLIGDDDSVLKFAKEYGLRCLQVKTNSLGTPLVPAIFEAANEDSRGKFVFINSDIILFPSFYRSAKKCYGTYNRCLGIGQRTDMNVKERIEFDSGWEDRLWVRVENQGRLHQHWGIDYFVCKGHIWDEIPDFYLGRYAYDNWLVATAIKNDVPVIDMTEVVLAVHQNHHRVYNREEEGKQEVHHNRSLFARLGKPLAGVAHATYRMEARDE